MSQEKINQLKIEVYDLLIKEKELEKEYRETQKSKLDKIKEIKELENGLGGQK